MPDLIRTNPVLLHPRIGLRLRIKMIALHPTRRRPRRSPQPQLRLIPQRCLDKRHQRLLVMRDAEILQREIAVRLVIAVRPRRKIVCPNRSPAICESRPRPRIKELTQDTLAIALAEHLQRSPPQFIEASPESLNRPRPSAHLHRINVQVQSVPTKDRLENSFVLPGLSLSSCDKTNPRVLERRRRPHLRKRATSKP